MAKARRTTAKSKPVAANHDRDTTKVSRKITVVEETTRKNEAAAKPEATMASSVKPLGAASSSVKPAEAAGNSATRVQPLHAERPEQLTSPSIGHALKAIQSASSHRWTNFRSHMLTALLLTAATALVAGARLYLASQSVAGDASGVDSSIGSTVDAGALKGPPSASVPASAPKAAPQFKASESRALATPKSQSKVVAKKKTLTASKSRVGGAIKMPQPPVDRRSKDKRHAKAQKSPGGKQQRVVAASQY